MDNLPDNLITELATHGETYIRSANDAKQIFLNRLSETIIQHGKCNDIKMVTWLTQIKMELLRRASESKPKAKEYYDLLLKENAVILQGYNSAVQYRLRILRVNVEECELHLKNMIKMNKNIDEGSTDIAATAKILCALNNGADDGTDEGMLGPVGNTCAFMETAAAFGLPLEQPDIKKDMWADTSAFNIAIPQELPSRKKKMQTGMAPKKNPDPAYVYMVLFMPQFLHFKIGHSRNRPFELVRHYVRCNGEAPIFWRVRILGKDNGKRAANLEFQTLEALARDKLRCNNDTDNAKRGTPHFCLAPQLS